MVLPASPHLPVATQHAHSRIQRAYNNRHRSQYGDYFGIGVAGYPEAHPDYIVDDEEAMKKNYWESLEYLKQKVGVRGRGAGWLLKE